MARVLLMVSLTAAAAERLGKAGPRRDVIELARAANGEIVYQETEGARRGLRQRVFGPHVRQAWATAGRVEPGDVVFADGEHNGIPLLFALAVRRRRPARVVVIGHLVSRPWKRVLLRVATRLGTPGTLVLHSIVQRDAVRGDLGRGWDARLLPYQVDTAYWNVERRGEPEATPFILAVGAENRDYATLVEAARGLDVRVLIAAGSYWAREAAAANALPPNVEYRSEPIPFTELRDLYARATAVVVPLHDVPNQSGVTTILEAMSCGVPVIVSASLGQQECIAGPLVERDGSFDLAATAGRGPALFGNGDACGPATGMYVPVREAAALRAAVLTVVDDAAAAKSMSRAATTAARTQFSIEAFVEAFRGLLVGEAPLTVHDSVAPDHRQPATALEGP